MNLFSNVFLTFLPRTLVTFTKTYTLAGTGNKGYKDGSLLQSEFYDLKSIGFGSHTFDLYVTDGNLIRKIYRTENKVETLAGSFNETGFIDGNLTEARFNNPKGIAVDHFGYVYVVDSGNKAIRRIDQNKKIVTTLLTNLTDPHSIAFDPSNSAYITDGNQIIYIPYLYTFPWENKVLIGSKEPGLAEGRGTNAKFNKLKGIKFFFDSIYVVDSGNKRVRRVVVIKWFQKMLDHKSYTYVGSGNEGTVDGMNPSFSNSMYDISPLIDLMYITDTGNNKIRIVNNFILFLFRFSFSVLGNGQEKSVDGQHFSIGAPSTSFNKPKGIIGTNLPGLGFFTTFYIAESGGNKIRVVDNFDILNLVIWAANFTIVVIDQIINGLLIIISVVLIGGSLCGVILIPLIIIPFCCIGGCMILKIRRRMAEIGGGSESGSGDNFNQTVEDAQSEFWGKNGGF